MSTIFCLKKKKRLQKKKNQVEKRTNVCYNELVRKVDFMLVSELKGVGPKMVRSLERLNIKTNKLI